MLMEAEGRNDRQEELLLHDISIAEFECEMLKKTKTKTIIYLIFLFLKKKKLNSKCTEVEGDLSINFSEV